MQLRSGATTGGTAPVSTLPRSPSPTPGGGVPDQIEIASPQRQEGDEEVSAPRTPVQSTSVYSRNLCGKLWKITIQTSKFQTIPIFFLASARLQDSKGA